MAPFSPSPFSDPFAGAQTGPFVSPIPAAAPSTESVTAGALVPADPPAPGLGPSFDFTGPPTAEMPESPQRFPFWHSSRLSTTWLSKGGSDGFGILDFELSTSAAPIYFDDVPALLITPGFGLHLWNAPTDLVLPAQTYDVYVDVSLRAPLSDRLGMSFGVTPGLYGDFREINSDSFQITGWGLGDFALNPRWTLVGGVAVVRQLESRVLPVGGVIWSPNEATRVELVVPRMRVARRIRSTNRGHLWTYAAGQFGGGSWAVTLDDGTTTLVTYNDLRISLGLEWIALNRIAGTAEVGYVFARDISAYGASQFTPTDALMFRLGVMF